MKMDGCDDREVHNGRCLLKVLIFGFFHCTFRTLLKRPPARWPARLHARTHARMHMGMHMCICTYARMHAPADACICAHTGIYV